MKDVLRRMSLWALIGCFALIGSAEAQIEISAHVITNTIGTVRTGHSFTTEDYTSLNPLVTASGENQTWDFTGSTYTEDDETGIRSFLLPADVVGNDEPAFADAGFVEMLSGVAEGDSVSAYFYKAIINNGLINFGGVFIGPNDMGEPDTSTVVQSPPKLQTQFPLSYQVVWEDSSSIIIDGIGLGIYVITETTVDGWGTLITPAGSANALRLNIRESTFLATEPPQLIDETFALDFVTEAPGDLSAYLLIDGDPDGGGKNQVEIVDAGYNVIESNTNVAIEDEARGLPEGFTLSQNYPNPFNPSTQIRYEIGEETDVRLNIYTLTGQLIETLVDARQPQGPYEVSFDAANLASGFYLYRLETGRGSATRLMSVVK